MGNLGTFRLTTKEISHDRSHEEPPLDAAAHSYSILGPWMIILGRGPVLPVCLGSRDLINNKALLGLASTGASSLRRERALSQVQGILIPHLWSPLYV